MNVTLRPELEQAIAGDVRAGRGAGADDFINKAVYHYVVNRERPVK